MVAMIAGLCILVIIATVIAIINVGHNPFIINATPTPAPSTASSSPSSRTSASPTVSPSSGHTGGQALTQVRTFYPAYARNASVLSQYVTPDLYARIKAAPSGTDTTDPVLCAVNTPSSFSYTPPVTQGDVVHIGVIESFGSGNNPTVNVTVRLSDLRVSDIACP